MDREAAVKLWRLVANGAPGGVVTGRALEAFATAVEAAERERLREDHAPLASAARHALDLLERIEIADGGKYGDLREVVSGLLCILGPNVADKRRAASA